MKTCIELVLLVWIGAVLVHETSGWQSDKVLLTDVKALTLHQGQMTNGRRSSPVPQLKCVGGTAGSAFVPQTVQCINRGSDGYDVQWECKTDMDNSYRFGKIQVSCEGYDYPDDPYILKGSCGLEYTLDLTEEGRQKKHSSGSGYNPYSHNESRSKSSSVVQDLIHLGMIAGVIYIIYKVCIAPRPPSNQGDSPPSYEETFRTQGPAGNTQPPPYGFRQDYMPGEQARPSAPPDPSYCGGQTHVPPTGTNTGGGGFWTGFGTGGLMGYLFGNSRRNHGYHHRPNTGWGWGGNNWGNNWGSNWGSGSGWHSSRTGSSWGGSSTRSSSGSSSSSSSSGTRTASGFGGTSRR